MNIRSNALTGAEGEQGGIAPAGWAQCGGENIRGGLTRSDAARKRFAKAILEPRQGECDAQSVATEVGRVFPLTEERPVLESAVERLV